MNTTRCDTFFSHLGHFKVSTTRAFKLAQMAKKSITSSRRDLIKKIFIPSVFILLFPISSHTQEVWNYNDAIDDNERANFSYYYSQYGYDNNSINDYSTIDYHYNYPSSCSQNRSDKEFHGYLHFGRRFDNSAAFTSGISSYQGTSTGPGPNGGYPGAPRGIYQTHYYDTSIYPNSYMQTYSR